MAAGDIIGHVTTLTGTAEVKHADGTASTLAMGDAIRKDDVVSTGKQSTVGLTFEDKTTFSLGSSGRIAIDDMVYDPVAKTGFGQISVQKGAVAFVSGDLPKTTPDAMIIKTPAMSIGIRGTAGAIRGASVVLLPESGGRVGELSVSVGGQHMTLNQPGTALSVGPGGSVSTFTMSTTQMQSFMGDAGRGLPPNSLGGSLSPATGQGDHDLPHAPPPTHPEQQGDKGFNPEKALIQMQALNQARMVQQDIMRFVKLLEQRVSIAREQSIEVATTKLLAMSVEEKAALADVTRLVEGEVDDLGNVVFHGMREYAALAHDLLAPAQAAFQAGDTATLHALALQAREYSNIISVDLDPNTGGIETPLYVQAQQAAQGFYSAVKELAVGTSLKQAALAVAASIEAMEHRVELAGQWITGEVITARIDAEAAAALSDEDLATKQDAAAAAAAAETQARQNAVKPVAAYAAAVAERDVRLYAVGEERLALAKLVVDYVDQHKDSAHASDWFGITDDLITKVDAFKAALALDGHGTQVAALLDETGSHAVYDAYVDLIQGDYDSVTAGTQSLHDNPVTSAIKAWVEAVDQGWQSYQDAAASADEAKVANDAAMELVDSAHAVSVQASLDYVTAQDVAATNSAMAVAAEFAEIVSVTAAQDAINENMANALASIDEDIGNATTAHTATYDVTVAADAATKALAAANVKDTDSAATIHGAWEKLQDLKFAAQNALADLYDPNDASAGRLGEVNAAVADALAAYNLATTLPPNFDQASTAAQNIALQEIDKAKADYANALAKQAQVQQDVDVVQSYVNQILQAEAKVNALYAFATAEQQHELAAIQQAATTAADSCNDPATGSARKASDALAAAMAARDLVDGNGAGDVVGNLRIRVGFRENGAETRGTADEALSSMNSTWASSKTLLGGLTNSTGDATVGAKIAAAQAALTAASTSLGTLQTLVDNTDTQIADALTAIALPTRNDTLYSTNTIYRQLWDVAEAVRSADAQATTASDQAQIASQKAADANAAVDVDTAKALMLEAVAAAKDAAKAAALASDQAAKATAAVQQIGQTQSDIDKNMADAAAKMKSFVEAVAWARADATAATAVADASKAVDLANSTADAVGMKAAIDKADADLSASTSKLSLLTALYNTWTASGNSVDSDAWAVINDANTRAQAAFDQLHAAGGYKAKTADALTQATAKLAEAQVQLKAALKATTLAEASEASAQAQKLTSEVQGLADTIKNYYQAVAGSAGKATGVVDIINTAYTNALEASARLNLKGMAAEAVASLDTVNAKLAALAACVADAKAQASAVTNAALNDPTHQTNYQALVTAAQQDYQRVSGTLGTDLADAQAAAKAASDKLTVAKAYFASLPASAQTTAVNDYLARVQKASDDAQAALKLIEGYKAEASSAYNAANKAYTDWGNAVNTAIAKATADAKDALTLAKTAQSHVTTAMDDASKLVSSIHSLASSGFTSNISDATLINLAGSAANLSSLADAALANYSTVSSVVANDIAHVNADITAISLANGSHDAATAVNAAKDAKDNAALANIHAGAVDGLKSTLNDQLQALQNLQTQYKARITVLTSDTVLLGTANAEALVSYEGNDTLTGAGGADTLTGGNGSDIFRYTAADQSTAANTDTITDFKRGTDKINLAGAAGYKRALYAWAGSLSATVAAVTNDTSVANAAVFFTDGTDGWLLVKGNGSGVTGYDGTLIKLANVSTPLATTDFAGGVTKTVQAVGTISLALEGGDGVLGGAGNDSLTLLTVANGDVAIDLGNGSDLLTLAGGNNTIAVANAETIIGGAGADRVTLTAAMVGTVDLGNGSDLLTLANADNAVAVANVETIIGGGGNDAVTLLGGLVGGTIDLGAGNDSLVLANTTNSVTLANVETVIGGTGNDTVILACGTASVDLGNGTDALVLGNGGGSVTVANVESIVGGAGNDSVTLTSAVANGSFDFKDGLDRLILANGDNSVAVSNIEAVTGGTGNDSITFATAVSNGAVDLGAGIDVVRLANGTNTVTIANAETILGGAGNDTVTLGANAAALVDLGAGVDRLVLGSGNNDLSVINVETIIGGAGNDRITLMSAQAGATLDLGAGNDALVLANATNVVTVSNIETVVGGSGNDTVILVGGSGSVDLGGGLDTLVLGNGSNTVTVTNVENITAGAGNDTVVLTTTVSNGSFDFSDGADRLVLANGDNSVMVANIETVTGAGGNDMVQMATAVANGAVDLGSGVDWLQLANGTNTLTVTNVEYLAGGSGNDTVTLGANAVGSIDLGAGSDRLILGLGNNDLTLANVETVTGGAGNDRITMKGALTSATLDLGAGNDVLVLANTPNTLTASNIETIIGGSGNDVVTMVGGAGTIDLGAGTDSLILGNGSNTVTVTNVENITAASGNDTVTLTTTVANGSFDFKAGSDRLILANGDNIVTVANIETVTGGAGNDTITFAAAASASVEGGDGLDVVKLASGSNTLVVSNVEQIIGGTGNDAVTLATEFTGTVSNVETLTAGAGNDHVTLTSAIANGVIDLGAGADVLQLANATNSVTVSNAEIITGGGGNDTVTLGAAVTGAVIDLGAGIDKLTLANGGNQLLAIGVERIVGGLGNDMVALGDALVNGNIDLGNGTDALALACGTNVLTVTNVESILGNDGADTITLGTPQSNVSIDLGNGNDTLTLADGSNTVVLANVETVLGGSGNDTVYLAPGAACVTIDLKGGSDTVRLSGGDNLVSLTNVETVFGGAGNDTVLLSSGTGTVALGAGWDTLVLGNGTNVVTVSNVEVLIAGAGNDAVTLACTVSGDLIDLGAGTDQLILANGANLVQTRGVETITGGSGNDTVYVADSLVNGRVDLGQGGGDTLVLANTGGSSLTVANTEWIIGNDGDDAITLAGAQSGNIDLGCGNDVLNLANGTNTLSVGNVETIMGGTGNDGVTLTATLYGGTIDLKAGIDTLTLATGDNLVTIANVESVIGAGGNDTVIEAGANATGTVDLGDGSDTLILGPGGSTLTVAHVETVIGGAGNDVITISGTQLPVLLDLGAGQDTVIVNACAASVADLAGQMQLANVETIRFTDGNYAVATLNGTAASEIVFGTQGDDTLVSGGGADLMLGGAGNDVYSVSVANKLALTIADSTGVDTINLAGGQDYLLSGISRVGDDLVIKNTNGGQIVIKHQYSGDGVEYLSFDGKDGVNLSTATSGSIIVGTAGDDLIVGTAAAETLVGNGGEDVFFGGGGADTFVGSNTRTSWGSIEGGTVAFLGTTDKLIANLSADGIEALVSGTSGTVTQVLANGATVTSTLINITEIDGGSGADTFIGGQGHFYFSGGAGNDKIVGDPEWSGVTAGYWNSPQGVKVNLTDGNLSLGGTNVAKHSALDGFGSTDSLVDVHNVEGSQFADIIQGGNDSNYLDGGAGKDTLIGGGGCDVLTVGINDYDVADGGEGYDALRIDTGEHSDANTATFARLFDVARNVTNIESIDLGGDGAMTLVVRPDDIRQMGGTINIWGDDCDNLILDGAWSVISRSEYGTVLTSGGATINLSGSVQASLWATPGNLTCLNGAILGGSMYAVHTLTALPAGGALFVDGVQLNIGDTFSQQQVDQGRVFYSQSGLSGSSSFTVDSQTIAVHELPGVSASAPVTTVTAGPLDYSEAYTHLQVLAGASVKDADSADFAGGRLVLSLSNSYSGETLTIASGSAAATSITLSGTSVKWGSTVIGTVSGGTDQQPLVIALNAAATPARVSDLLKAVVYEHDTDILISGTRVLQVELTDGDGSAMPTLTRLIAVHGESPPVLTAQTDLGGIDEDNSITFTADQLLANASDPEGGPVSLVSVNSPHGYVVDNHDGTYTFQPSLNFNGDAQITYLVGDQTGLVTSASAVVHIAAIDDPTVVSPVTLPQTGANQPIILTQNELLGDSFDPDNALHVANLTVDQGTVTDNGDGTYTFTPAAGVWDSVATFTFDVVTDAGESLSTQGYLYVNPPIAPTADAVSHQGVLINHAYNLNVGSHFTNPDDTMTFTATLSDGVTPLPAWLSLNPSTGVLSGTPGAGDTGHLEILITATDTTSLSASTTVALDVWASNAAPTSTAIATQNATEQNAFLVNLGSHFADADIASHGDSLTFSATLSDGSPLPEWLTLCPVTGQLQGTPWHSDIGSLSITVKATDVIGAATQQTFTLNVLNDTRVYGANAAGAALQFDGVNDFATASTSTGNFGTGDFTIEGWFNPRDVVGTQVLFGKDKAGDGNGFALMLEGDSLVFKGPGVGNNLTIDEAVAPDTWEHVALTREGQTFTLYLNGNEVGQYTASGTLTYSNSFDFLLGAHTNATGTGKADFFTGLMDNVRVWSDARTHGEIFSSYQVKTPTATDNLVANWTMDSVVSGGVPADNGGGPGLQLGAASTSGSDDPMRINMPRRAMVFEGDNTEVTFSNLQTAGNLTVEGWFRIDKFDEGARVFDFGDGSANQRVSWSLTGDGHLVASINGSSVTSPGVVDNNWHHIATVFSSTGSMTLYVDGVAAGSVTGLPTATIAGASSVATVGGAYDGTAPFFTGAVAELRVWDIARTAADIAGSMNTRIDGDQYGLMVNAQMGEISQDWTSTVLNLSDYDTVGTVSGEPQISVLKEASASFTISTPEDTALLSRVVATNVHGVPLWYGVDGTGPSHGWVEMDNSTGVFHYTPYQDYTGNDSFTVAISEGEGEVIYKTISINVTPVDDPASLKAPPSLTKPAISLDGETYVAVTGGLPINDGPATFEMWVRTSNPEGGTLLSLQDIYSEGTRLELGISNGHVTFDTGEMSYLTSEGTITDGAWHHVAATITQDNSSVTMKLYVDGVLVASDVSEEWYNLIGDDVTIGSWFSGELSDFRVYNGVRTQAQIQSDLQTTPTTAPSDLMAWLKLDSTLTDSSLSGAHDAAVIGNFHFDDRVVAVTKAATAVHIDGTTIYDPDATANLPATLRMELEAGHGTLSLANTSGLTFQSGYGNGTGHLIFTGSQTAINNALKNATFTPATGFFGWEEVRVKVDEMNATTTRVTEEFLPILVMANASNVSGSTIIGSAGADAITLATGVYTDVDLGGGNDSLTLVGNGLEYNVANVETIVGSGGGDCVTLAPLTGTGTVDLGGGQDALVLVSTTNTLSVSNIESVVGTESDDTLTLVSVSKSVVDLGWGTDTVVITGTGNNSVALLGVEVVQGGAGNDAVAVMGSYQDLHVSLGGGNDTLLISDNFALLNLDGGAGNDTLVVSGTYELWSATVSNFETVGVAGTGSITLLDTQAAGLTFDGGGGDLTVTMVASPGGANFSSQQFTNWGADDHIVIVDGTTGNDTLVGTSKDDFIQIAGGVNTVDGGSGFDWVEYTPATGQVVIDLANGTGVSAGSTDTLVGIEGVRTSVDWTTVIGSAGDDSIWFSGYNVPSAATTIDGGAGTDTIIVQDYTNLEASTLTSIERFTLLGGTYQVDIKAAILAGLSSSLNWNNASSEYGKLVQITLDTADTSFDASGYTFTNWGASTHWNSGEDGNVLRIDALSAAGDTTLIGSTRSDEVFGGYSNDTLVGGAGADWIDGRDGNDLLQFAAGDVVAGESIDGGWGIDTVAITADVDFRTATMVQVEAIQTGGHTATVTWNQGQLFQTFIGVGGQSDQVVIDAAGETWGVTIELGGRSFVSWEATDTISIIGSSSYDTISGTSSHDVVNAGAGDDHLWTSAGADTLMGGAGSDSFYLSADTDPGTTLDGGAGTDMINTSGWSLANVWFTGIERIETDCNQIIDGHALDGQSIEILGIAGWDLAVNALNGGSVDLSKLTFSGSAPNTVAVDASDSTNHTVIGTVRSDTITAGSGNDTLDGGAGSDTLTGGGGSDTFQMHGSLPQLGTDHITDFDGALDRFLLSNGTFGLGASGTLSTAAGSLQFVKSATALGGVGVDVNGADSSTGAAILVIGDGSSPLQVWYTADQHAASTINSYQIATLDNVTDLNSISATNFAKTA
ncbi:MAG: LamG-like jellyroll fold domain-containing protein [Solirubrobacterales bacterium]